METQTQKNLTPVVKGENFNNLADALYNYRKIYDTVIVACNNVYGEDNTVVAGFSFAQEELEGELCKLLGAVITTSAGFTDKREIL